MNKKDLRDCDPSGLLVFVKLGFVIDDEVVVFGGTNDPSLTLAVVVVLTNGTDGFLSRAK